MFDEKTLLCVFCKIHCINYIYLHTFKIKMFYNHGDDKVLAPKSDSSEEVKCCPYTYTDNIEFQLDITTTLLSNLLLWHCIKDKMFMVAQFLDFGLIS